MPGEVVSRVGVELVAERESRVAGSSRRVLRPRHVVRDNLEAGGSTHDAATASVRIVLPSRMLVSQPFTQKTETATVLATGYVRRSPEW